MLSKESIFFLIINPSKLECKSSISYIFLYMSGNTTADKQFVR